MANDSTYNGWRNYETWLVNLWNDDAFSDTAHDIYEQARTDKYNTREQRATNDLAEQIKEQVEEMNPHSNESGLFSDLLTGALSDVDWREIAEHYIDDLDETEFEDEAETEAE